MAEEEWLKKRMNRNGGTEIEERETEEEKKKRIR